MSGNKGILNRIKSHLDRNRLGELLVIHGRLSPLELKSALSRQQTEKRPLGQILIEAGLVKRQHIFTAIATQWALRSLAGIVTLMITFSLFNVRAASANSITEISTAIGLKGASIPPVASYPGLFGTAEKKSGDLSAFTKWGAMFARFDSQMKQPASATVLKKWQSDLESLRGLSLDEMVVKVNTIANRVPYINDSRNWGKSDYWETPVEFFTKGGDCEDFAIAKYASLRALGVPDSRMRIAIVRDTQKGIPHAVLIVYTDNGPVVLDNQIKTVTAQSNINHYKPIFSINRSAWWLHKDIGGTVVASR